MIKSEEGRFWKFITSDKYLDEEKLKMMKIYLEIFIKTKDITMLILNHHMPKILIMNSLN